MQALDGIRCRKAVYDRSGAVGGIIVDDNDLAVECILRKTSSNVIMSRSMPSASLYVGITIENFILIPGVYDGSDQILAIMAIF